MKKIMMNLQILVLTMSVFCTAVIGQTMRKDTMRYGSSNTQGTYDRNGRIVGNDSTGRNNRGGTLMTDTMRRRGNMTSDRTRRSGTMNSDGMRRNGKMEGDPTGRRGGMIYGRMNNKGKMNKNPMKKSNKMKRDSTRY